MIGFLLEWDILHGQMQKSSYCSQRENLLKDMQEMFHRCLYLPVEDNPKNLTKSESVLFGFLGKLTDWSFLQDKVPKTMMMILMGRTYMSMRWTTL